MQWFLRIQSPRHPLMPPPHMHAETCSSCTCRKPGWFCELPAPALAEYDSLSHHLMVLSGTFLFMEGQMPRGVSVLCMGEVKLTKSSARGRTLLVRIAKAGDVLGLSAGLANTPYEVTAEALGPVQLKTFRREDFIEFLHHHTEGTINATNCLNTEYRRALADATRLALSSTIAGRFAHLLLEMAIEAGTAQESQPVVQMTLRHEDIASMLGCSRESVTRLINDLKRRGIISISGTKVSILRKYALESVL